MEVKLRVRERLLLRSILPKEGDITTIRIVRELRNSLEFTEADLERLHISPPCHICGALEEHHVEFDKDDGATHPFVPNRERIGWDQGCLHCDGLAKGHDDSDHPFESKDFPVSFPLGPNVVKLMRAQLQELSQQKKMTEELLDLYDVLFSEPSGNGVEPIPMKRKAKHRGR